MTHKKLSDEAAYQVMKSIWESYDEYKGAHPWARLWSHKKMTKGLGEAVAPLHSGAIRFYKKQGVWSDKATERQLKLLKGK